MRTYSVSEVSDMLGVNAETVRRWIRSGKLRAMRAMGPGGNTIVLEDIVAFANKPPRTHLLSLEAWLETAGINYQKIEDPKADKSTASKVAATVGLAAASSIIPIVGPAIAATAITSAATKSKNYQSYSIQLVDSIKDATTNDKESVVGETNQTPKHSERLPYDDTQVVNVPENNAFAQEKIDAPKKEAAENTINILDEIAHAKKLLDAEIITQEEFATIKTRLIAKI